MMKRILLAILFINKSFAMQNSSEQKPSDSDLASGRLYHVMVKASNIINKTSLLGDDGTFDSSEKSLLPRVQSLLAQGADPNCRFSFIVPMGIGEKCGVLLPTSMELAQKLQYQEIVSLFSTQKEKTK